jgi:putative Mg2+ transporter-C (MgtC) family protein
VPDHADTTYAVLLIGRSLAEVAVLPVEFGQQLEISIRLLLASALGAAIGFEREMHAHPAGMRTHLLVALGSAGFSVLSIYFFVSPAAPNGSLPTDPSRIAAQIVSGIGFLGAGAIIKYGTSVRGLTTAASLWATAAVGMAAGAGALLVALVTTGLIVFSLGPLNWVINHFQRNEPQVFRLRLLVTRLEAVGEVSRALAGTRIEIGGVSTQRVSKNRYEIELDLRPPAGTRDETVITAVSTVPDVEILEAGVPKE